jgi:hypothetical protein
VTVVAGDSRVVHTCHLAVVVDSSVVLSNKTNVFVLGLTERSLHVEGRIGALDATELSSVRGVLCRLDVLLCARLVVSLKVLPLDEVDIVAIATLQCMVLNAKGSLALSDSSNLFLQGSEAAAILDCV